MKLRYGTLVPLMLLAGCGLPPAVIVASYAVDGISYVASGKSLTDHALSVLAQRDCALHRVITEADLCRDDVASSDQVTVVAALPPDEDGVDGSLDLAPKRLQPRWGPITASLPATDAGEPSPGVVASEGAYLVLASFSYWVNTDRFVARYPTLAPEVVPAWVGGEVVYRVVTISGLEAVGAAGLSQAWPLRLCRDIEDVLAACANDSVDAVNIAALTR
ncbi:MAG: hypothetical protein ACTSWM_00570 [Alphaproteobacteria bacterium]